MAFRDQFPVLESLAYLNAGTDGPIPRAALETARAELDAQGAEGRLYAHFARRFELGDGAALIDSPGVRDFAPAVAALDARTLGFTEEGTLRRRLESVVEGEPRRDTTVFTLLAEELAGSPCVQYDYVAYDAGGTRFETRQPG